MEKKERKILEKNISRISVIDENDTNCKFCNELFTQNDGKIEYNGKIFCSENCNKLFSRNKKPVDFMKTIGINLRFLNAEMKKMKPQIQTICNNYFSEKMENILITGKETGVGKTFLAIAILRQYALTFPKNCFFINCTDLFIEIKNSFTNDKTSESEVIKKYSDYDFLVIDDIGAEKISEWAVSILYAILNKRYETMKTTVMTTNYENEELTRKYNRRILSRMSSGKKLNLSGKDKRIS